VVDERRGSLGFAEDGLLGLRNLTILSKAVDLIEQTTGKRIDPLKFPLDDKATYALLQRGETKGVFQLESGGIRDLLQRMKPDQFTDIIATNALYRPGPLEGGMVDDLRQYQARPPAARIQAPGAERDLGRDQFDHGLPRTGDADSQSAGRHPAGVCLHGH
jgi:DNA polymerase III alpha subunit